MTAAQQRKLQRAVHLGAGVVTVAYLYGPGTARIHDAIRFIVLPLLVLTGFLMWQAPRLRRLRKTLSRRRAPDPAASARPAGLGAKR